MNPTISPVMVASRGKWNMCTTSLDFQEINKKHYLTTNQKYNVFKNALPSPCGKKSAGARAAI